MIKPEDLERLKELKDSMLQDLEEIQGIIRRTKNQSVIGQFKAYTHSNIQVALTDDHDYLGGCPASLESLIDDLENENQEEGAEPARKRKR